jgi:hypothetical protein
MRWGRQLCISFECFLPLPVRAECGAGAELGFQPINSAAVWTCSNSQGDPFCGFDVFCQRGFSLTEVQNIRTADAFGYSLTFGRILGHPVEGAGHFGGGSGRLVRLGLLLVELGDPGVQFRTAPMSAPAPNSALTGNGKRHSNETSNWRPPLTHTKSAGRRGWNIKLRLSQYQSIRLWPRRLFSPEFK